MKKFIFLFLLFPLTLAAQYEGNWYSSFVVAGTPMRMNLTVQIEPEISLTIKDPDSQFTINSSKVTLGDSTLDFEIETIALRYSGKLDDKGVISGTMRQNGIEWPVTFHRTEQDKIVVEKPQTPKAPFPYSIEKLKIPNGEIMLGATLTLPDNFNAETPIVVLASGSGPQNRNCEIMGHEMFWVMADHFGRNGIACLRFDDRGVGESNGTYQTATLNDFGSDVEACAKYLRKEKKYKNPLGLIGHSEGGMHTLIAANNYKKIDFIVQLSAVGTNGGEVLIEQQYLIPKASGMDEEYCEWNKNIYAGIVSITRNENIENRKDSIQSFLMNQYDNAPESYDKSTTNKAQFVTEMYLFLGNDWAGEFINFYTADYLKKMKMPLLAITGEKDIQVPAKSNLDGFRSYENATCYEASGLNHLLQTCNECTFMEYAELEETIDPEVLKIMTDWILDQR